MTNAGIIYSELENILRQPKKNLTDRYRMSIETAYGTVPLEKLIHTYNVAQAANKRHVQKRNEFNQTDEGKRRNRERAKAYYERNKALVREKARARYTEKRLAESTAASENPQE